MTIPKDTDNLPGWISANVPTELAASSLFRFEVTLQVDDPGQPGKKRKIEVDILPDLDLDMDILEEQMQEVPAQYAFWSAVYSELRLAVAIAERNLKVRRGRATKATQEEAREAGTRLTEKQVKDVVEADAKLIKADLSLAKAQMLNGKVWHMLEALKMKHEVSRSLIGLKRAEHEKST